MNIKQAHDSGVKKFSFKAMGTDYIGTAIDHVKENVYSVKAYERYVTRNGDRVSVDSLRLEKNFAEPDKITMHLSSEHEIILSKSEQEKLSPAGKNVLQAEKESETVNVTQEKPSEPSAASKKAGGSNRPVGSSK